MFDIKGLVARYNENGNGNGTQEKNPHAIRSQKMIGNGAIPKDIAKTPFGDRKNTMLQQNPASTPLKSLNLLKSHKTFSKPELSTPINTPLSNFKSQQKQRHLKSIRPSSVDFYDEEIPLNQDYELPPVCGDIPLTDADIDRIINFNAPTRTPIPPPTFPPTEFQMPTIIDNDELFAFNLTNFNFNDKKSIGIRNDLRSISDDDDDDLPPLMEYSDGYDCFF